MQNWSGVVGIVASAGGLEAVSLLAQNLPKDSGAIYVLAQHMSPTHKSLLGQLLARETELPVIEIVSGMVAQPNTIYFTPPNSNVLMEDGKLLLVEPSGHPASPKPSGDLLLKSIAREYGEKCVAVILSGTGSDGSYGTQAVREAGGITIAQDPVSAKYDGMPSSAIETGCIDLTLIPEQIGQHLEKILAAPRDFDSLRQLNVKYNRLADLLQIVFARTRVSFRDYKENTINRRIARRMTALSIERYEDYVDFCRSSQDEVDALFRDFLISVTRFFRDPEQFEQLQEEIKEMVAERGNEPLRIWIAGCATGEEAYSIAILIAEAMGGLATLRKSRVQIFATDIDDRALEVARGGSYPAAAANDIPVEYLSRYFTVEGDRIEVKSELRSVMLFSHHNIFQDPPFLNLDLASIRNVLIYFNSSLQEKVLSRIHYSLSPTGLLFLGTSETVGVLDVLFEGRSQSDKIFGKRNLSRRSMGDFENLTSGLVSRNGNRVRGPSDVAETGLKDRDNEQFEALLRAIAPTGFIATRGGDIVRLVGDITKFVQLSESTNLKLSVRLLRGGLGEDAQNLIAVAGRSHERRIGQWLPISSDNDSSEVRIVCYPFKVEASSEESFLCAIETREADDLTRVKVEDLSEKERVLYIRQVELEMSSTREALQQTVEELQTSNEELQSLNEELQSTNEELQATNEELETSNEELQSTNEELITVNEEMQINAAELHKVSTELSATFAYAPFPMLMIDEALQVRYASRDAMSYLGYDSLPSAGLHLSQCRLPEGLPSATKLCNEALRMREPRTATLYGREEMLQMIVVPFQGRGSEVRGLTMSILSMDIFPASAMLAQIEKLGDISHWMVDLEAGKLTWSPGVFKIHGLSDDQDEPALDGAINYYHPNDRDLVRTSIEHVVNDGATLDFEARLVKPDGHIVPVRAIGSGITNHEGDTVGIVGTFRDMSSVHEREILIEHFAQVQDTAHMGFFSFDVTDNKPYWSKGLYHLLGVEADDHVPSLEAALDAIHPDDRPLVDAAVKKAITKGQGFSLVVRMVRSDGEIIRCSGQGSVRKTSDGNVSHVFGSFTLVEDSTVSNEIRMDVH